MRRLILLLVFITLSIPGFSQAQQDYDEEISRFAELYNAMDDDGLREMHSELWRVTPEVWERLWPKGRTKDMLLEYGAIVSYKYVGDEQEGTLKVYEVRFTKALQFIKIALDEKNKITTYRLNMIRLVKNDK